MTEDRDKMDRTREVGIQVRSAEILDQALREFQAREPDAVIKMDTLLSAVLLARISAQQERILKELRGIHGHVGTM